MPVPLFIIYRPNVNANIHLNHYPKNSPLPQLAARAIFVRSILLYYETSKSEKVTVSPHLLNTPAGMVRPDRGNGARGTREWCSLTA